MSDSPSSKGQESHTAAFLEAFNLLDRDCDGYIDRADITVLLSTLGTVPSDAEVADLIRPVDYDGSGELNFRQFTTLMTSIMKNSSECALEVFSVFDADNNGVVSPSELEAIMCKLHAGKLSSEQVQQMIEDTGFTGTNDITYQRFLSLLFSAKEV